MNMNKLFNNMITNLDAPRPWGLYFQDTASPQMEALVELHDNIMFYLVIILFGVAWILLSIIRNYVNNKYIKNNGTLIELIWTIASGFILILIAFPSFKLLYLMDEVTDPSLTVYVKEYQWYVYPEYINIDDLDIDIDDLDISDLEEWVMDYNFFMDEDIGGEEEEDEDAIEVEYIGGDSGDDSNSPPESSDSEDDSTENRGVKRTASDANSDSPPELIADEGNLSSRELEFKYKLDSVIDVISGLESRNVGGLSDDYIAKTAQHDLIVETAAAERRTQLESGEQRGIINATQNLHESSYNMNTVLLESLRNEAWLTAEDRAELVGAERTHNECREILDDIRRLGEEVSRADSSDSTAEDTDSSNSSNNTDD